MKFSYMLAPLEDVSSNALRTLCFKHGASSTFTEMTRLDGLARKNNSTWKKIECNDDTPTHIQLLANKEANLKIFLDMFTPTKGFQGFNLNLGCPSPDVIKLGLGCAMMKRVSKLNSIINVFHAHNYQVSIKMRLGLNEYEKRNNVYINTLKSVNADFFIIHARHGREVYKESKADSSVYPACIATGKTIIANGDIETQQQIEALKQMGVHGAMIGRAAVRNPAIFNEIQGKKSPTIAELITQYLELSERFKESSKYKTNVLKYIGKKTVTTSDTHVQG